MKSEITIEVSLKSRAASSRLFSRVSLALAVAVGVAFIFLLPLPYQNILQHTSVAKPFPAVAADAYSAWHDILFEGIYLITTAVIAVLILNAVVAFSKYHSRLAEHLECVAASIALAGTESDRVKYYAEILTLSNVRLDKDSKVAIADLATIAEALAKLK